MYRFFNNWLCKQQQEKDKTEKDFGVSAMHMHARGSFKS